MVLETVVSSVLTRVLGDYINELDSKSLNVALWNGNVVLHNLELKTEALQKFKLPVVVQAGYIGKLSLRIPWSNLRNEAISIKLENIYAVATPTTQLTADEKEEQQKAEEAKKKKIEELESSLKKQNASQQSDKPQVDPFYNSLVTKVVDNIQLEIKNLHIRYEDSISNPHRPFCMGLFLDNFSILSTDPSFTPAFLTEPHTVIYKLLSVNNFAVYWNPGEKPTVYKSSADLVSQLKGMISNANNRYIVKPVSLSVRAIINKGTPTEHIPQLTAEISVEDIELHLTEAQYSDIVDLMDHFNTMEKRKKYIKYRPFQTPKDSPRAWWMYAINASLADKPSSRFNLSAKYLEQRRKDRLQYIFLYKNKLRSKLEPKDGTVLDAMERKLAAEDIVFFRYLAKRSLKDEGITFDDTPHSAQSRWFGWLNWSKTSDQTQNTLFGLTEDQKKQFYEAIEYDPLRTTAPATEAIPQDVVKFQINLFMKAGSLELIDDVSSIGRIAFKEFALGTKVYPETLSFGISLLEMQVTDFHNKSTKFPLIVTPMEPGKRLFDLLFKYKPFDDPGTDIYLFLQCQPLQVIYNKTWTDKIVSFFAKKDTSSFALNRSTQVWNLQKYRSQIEASLEGRQMLSISINIQAPQVLIPLNIFDDETTICVADLGKLSILNDPFIENQQDLERRIYSTFHIQMSSLKLFLVSSEYWTEQLRTNSDYRQYVIDNFDVNFSVEICTISNLDLPKMRIFATLPSLSVSVSPKMVHDLRAIATVVTDSDTTPKRPSQWKGQTEAELPQELLESELTKATDVEVAFSVTDLSLTLKRDNEKGSLVVLSLQNMDAHALQRKDLLKVDVVLQSFSVLDCTEPNVEFAYLARSNRDTSVPLIKLCYSQVQKESPDYRGVESLIYASFGTLDITFNRATIVELIQFSNLLASDASKSSETLASVSKSKKQSSSNAIQLRATASLNSVKIVLNKNCEKMALFEVSGMTILCSLFANGSMELSGNLNKLTAQDLADLNSVDIISIQEGEDLVQFSYYTFSPTAADFPGYSTELKVHTNSVRFLYKEKFISDIQAYFNEISEMQQLIQSTANYATDVVQSIYNPSKSATEDKGLKFEFSVISPQIKFPSSSGEYILADFGQIYAVNKFKVHKSVPVHYEKISATISAMNIQSYHNDGSSFPILEDVDLALVFERTLDDKDHHFPAQKLAVDIPKVGIILNKDQLNLAIDLYKQFTRKPEGTQPSNSTTEAKHALLSITLRVSQFSINFWELLANSSAILSSGFEDISAEPIYDEYTFVKLELQAFNIDKKRSLIAGKSDSYVLISRLSGNLKVQLYKSEICYKSTNPKWSSFIINVKDIRNEETLIIECFYVDAYKSTDRLVGSFETTLNQLLSKKEFELINKEKLKKKRDYKNSGLLKVISHEVIGDTKKKPISLTPSLPFHRSNISDVVTKQSLACLNFNLLLVKMGQNNKDSVIETNIDLIEVIDMRSIAVIKRIAVVDKASLALLMTQSEMKMTMAINGICCNVVPQLLLPLWDFVMQGVARFTKSDQPIEADPVKFTLSLETRDTELYLYENTYDLASKKLIIQTCLTLKYYMFSDMQRIETIAEDLQILRDINNLPESTVLSPVNVFVNYYVSQSRGSLSVVLNSVPFMLTYSDCKVLLGSLNSFKSPQQTEQAVQNTNPSYVFQMEIEFKEISFELVAESPEIPALLHFSITGPHFRGNFLHNMFQRLSIRAQYFNMQKAYWESLIEPWSFSILYHSSIDSSKLTITASDPLDIAVTESFLQDTLSIWTKDFSSQAATKRFQALSIRNHTLQRIWYKISDMEKEKELLPYAQEAANISVNMRQTKTKKMYFRIDGFVLNDLNLLEECIQPIQVQFRDQPRILIYQVSFNQGNRLVSFRSRISVKNGTTIPLQLKINYKLDATENCHVMPPLSAGEDSSIPLEFESVGKLCIRPLNGDNSPVLPSNLWSDEIDCATLAGNTSRYINLHMKSDKQSVRYYFFVSVSEQRVGSLKLYDITLLPALTVENLLPCPLKFILTSNEHSAEVSLKRGEHTTVYSHRLGERLLASFLIPDLYSWSQLTDINSPDSKKITMMDEEQRYMHLFFERSILEGVHRITVYSKYWILNRSEFHLMYLYDKETPAAGTGSIQRHVRDLSKYSSDWFSLEKCKSAQPFLYSKSKCRIQLENGKISKSVSIKAVQQGELSISDKAEQSSFYLGMSVTIAPQKYRRTKLVTIGPRYLLVNNSGQTIYYQQIAVDQRFKLEPGQVVPFHWPSNDKKATQRLSISLDVGSKWRWSGAFSLTDIGNNYVKLHEVSKNEDYFLPLHISNNEGTLVVIFKPKSKESFPYRIDNYTGDDIVYWQEENDTLVHQLSPNMSAPWGWDDNSKPHYVSFKIDKVGFKKRFSLDKIKKYSPRSKVYVQVFPEGPCKVIRFTSLDGNKEPKSNKKEEIERPLQSAVVIDIASIGISIIDKTPQELLFISIQGIQATYATSEAQTSLQVVVRYIQMDNQLYYTPFPVLMRPVSSDRDFFQMSVVKSNEFSTVDFYNYFSVLMQELDLDVDATLLNAVLKLSNINYETISFGSQKANQLELPTSFPMDSTDTSQMMYFEILHINPIKINISFFSPEYLLVREKGETEPLDLLVGGVVGKVPNIDNAALELNALLLEYPAGTRQDIVSRITEHYISQAIRKSYRILGSFEFLGDPINSVKNLGVGIKDFFYEPAKGIIHGPDAFKKGLTKGTRSLLKGTVYGLFNASSKITQSLSKGIATLSMDQEYQMERTMKSAHKPEGIKEGIIEGAKDFGKGVFDGITGLVVQPVKGAQNDGAVGFLKGMGKGVLGVSVKPISGVLDLTTRVSQGISSKAMRRVSKRVRYPRYFDSRLKILEPYNEEKSFRQLALMNVKAGKYLAEGCDYHIILDKKVYMLCKYHILCVEAETLTLNWKIRYSRITNVSVNNSSITIKEGKDSSKKAKGERSSRIQLNLLEKSHVVHATDTAVAQEIFNELSARWKQAQRYPDTPPSPGNSPHFLKQLFSKESKADDNKEEAKPKGNNLLTKLKRASKDIT